MPLTAVPEACCERVRLEALYLLLECVCSSLVDVLDCEPHRLQATYVEPEHGDIAALYGSGDDVGDEDGWRGL